MLSWDHTRCGLFEEHGCRFEEFRKLADTWIRETAGGARLSYLFNEFVESHPSLCTNKCFVEYVYGRSMATVLEDLDDARAKIRAGARVCLNFALYLTYIAIRYLNQRDRQLVLRSMKSIIGEP